MRLRQLAVLIGFVIGLCALGPAAAARSKDEIRDDQDRQQRIAAAWAAGDEAAVLRIFDEKPDARAYRSNRECYWQLAVTLEHAGRYAAARDFYVRVADGSGDPDALWGLRRCVLAMGPEKAAAQARALAKERPMLARVLPALLLARADDAALIEQMTQGVSASAQAKDVLAEVALRTLKGDLLFASGRTADALMSYAYAAMDRKTAPLLIRTALAFGAADYWKSAQDELAGLSRLGPADAFVSPSADSMRTRVRSGLSAWERRQTDRVSAERRAAYEAAPPPTGLDWGKAIAAAFPMPPVEATAMGEVWHKWETERWRILWNPASRELYAWLADAGSAQKWQDSGPGWLRRVLPPDSLWYHWQPEFQCYRVRDPHQRPEDPFCFMLFANGDVFIGAEQFAGGGVYFSPGREPYEGICYFGRPPGVAQRVAEVLEQTEGEGGMQSLHVKLADHSEFAGTGIIESGVLYPASNGRIQYPGRGFFFGRFTDGTPDHGMFKASDGRLFVIHGHRLALRYGAGQGRGEKLSLTEDFLSDKPEMNQLESGLLEFLDGQTGWLMLYDPEKQVFEERYDAKRQDLYRIHQKFARYDKEREERGAQARAEIEAERKEAEKAALQESIQLGRNAFQFSAPKRNDRCIRCKGAGQLYVGSSVTQGYRYDENNKTLVDSNLHVSGHMEVCHWCNGTGKR